MMFKHGNELLEICSKENITISEAMVRREIELTGNTRENILARMQKTLDVMKSSAHGAIDNPQKTMGGLIGGEAKNLANSTHRSACGDLMKKAVTYSLSVLEVNTSMGVIVAAPTAGSSGVLPGGLIAVSEHYDIPDDKVVMALFNAAAIGYIITKNATVSGAEGGCQAEVGAASAMTASAIVELLGGTPEQCLDSASTAIANLLGLVCDPIGGLVEAPCQKRNAAGASNALVCAEMALSGITHLIPFDETIAAMYEVGKSIPSSLRETARGGMATTPTACRLCRK